MPPSAAVDLALPPPATVTSAPSGSRPGSRSGSGSATRARSSPSASHHPSAAPVAGPSRPSRSSPSRSPSSPSRSRPYDRPYVPRDTPYRMVVLRPNPPPVSSPALAQVIRELAEREGIMLPGPVPVAAPSTPTRERSWAAIAAAAESASEWNSLLIQARAERGPQWDILGQRYLVDESSDLYYDPRPLNPPPAEPPSALDGTSDTSPTLPEDASTGQERERPMVNGILHDPGTAGASASPGLGTIGIGGLGTGGQGTFSPSLDGREGSRYETPTRRSLRSSAPNGV